MATNKFGRIETDLTSIHGEVNLVKWMVGLVLGGVAALILKSFFG